MIRFLEALGILLLVGALIAAFLWLFVRAVSDTAADRERDYIRPTERDV